MEERPTLPSDVLGPPLRRRFPGLANQIKYARRFVERRLGTSPQTATAALLTSELATNAITHSASGSPGGKFEVTISVASERTRIEVRDFGGREQPRAQHTAPCDISEHGRGLDLVEALATTWGTEQYDDGQRRMVWFELIWDEGSESPDAHRP